MNFNEHFNLRGKHAFLGASTYHWINYDDDKLITTYNRNQAAQQGIILHDFASQCIKLGQKLPKSKKTLNMYVNDAIGYRMKPEQILYFSDNCFGTTDAISFNNKFLRIHDYKSGLTPASEKQLLVYASIFCLEYKIRPSDIDIELRIYQNDEILYFEPTLEDLVPIMDKIVHFDKIIDKIKQDMEV